MPILTQKQVRNIAQHRSQARLEGAAARVHAASEALHYAMANYAEEGLVTDDLEVRGKLLDEVTRCIHDCARKRDAECEELKRIETRSALDELAALQLEAITWDPRSQWRFEGATDPCTTCVNTRTYATNRTCPTCNGTRTINRRIRAIASEPGPEGGIIAVLEAPTAGALRVQIERSGLVTNTGHALFLGGELAAIERKL